MGKSLHAPLSAHAYRTAIIAIFALALAVRSVGLFRALDTGASFHPDVAKQMVAVHNYLKGLYVWYVGSLAYDGYPYGLNHVDEWLIRASWPLIRGAASFLQPAAEWPFRPNRLQIHFLSLIFRVLYGMLALILFCKALQRLSIPPSERLLWLMAAALAPILSVTTHFATGDVGTDLFAIAAITFFAHARIEAPRTSLFLASGAMCGMAFACKYHGVLAGLAPGLWLLLAPIAWKRRVQLGLALALGAVAGFVLLTPHVLWKTSKTLKLIWLSFHYIKDYNVPASFLELPFWVRARISIAENFPIVVGAIGSALMALGAIALAIAVRQFLKSRTHATAWSLAALLAPFAIIALSIVGKPQIQPFHFSFVPLLLMAGIAAVGISLRRGWRLLGAVFLIGAIAEYAAIQRGEWAYWSREDIMSVARRMRAQLAAPLHLDEPVSQIGTLAVESDNLAVFRNRPQSIALAGGAIWTNAPHERLPSTPWPLSRHWIFADFPAFPRDSRWVALQPGRILRRGVVQREEFGDLAVELTTGLRESLVCVTVDGRSKEVFLRPNEIRVLSFERERARRIQRGEMIRRVFDVSIVAHGAPALARFGPVSSESSDPGIREAKLACGLFYSGTNTLKSGYYTVLHSVALWPGRYAFEIDAAEEASLTLLVKGVSVPHPHHVVRVPFTREGNQWRAEWTNTPELLFANLDVEIENYADRMQIIWRVRPLEAHAWPNLPPEPPWKPAYSFSRGKWIIGNVEWPEKAGRGGTLVIRPRVLAMPEGIEEIGQAALFIHLMDEQGRQVFAHDIPLERVPSRFGGADLDHQIGPLDLPPGRYEIRVGLYNPQTGKRYKPDAPHGRDRRLTAGSLVID